MFRSISARSTLIGLFLGLSLGLAMVAPKALGAAAPQKEITIIADVWCPINCELLSANKGVMVDIATYVFEKAGYKVKYSVTPWSRAVEEVRAGRMMGLIGVTRAETPDFIYPEKELAQVKFCFYTRPDSTWTYTGDKSLDAVKVGLIADYNYGDASDHLNKRLEDKNRVEVLFGDGALERNLTKLEQKRIDATVESSIVMNYLSAKLKFSPGQFREAGCTPPLAHYIAFSPQIPESKEYAKILSNGIAELRKSGEMSKIEAKYNIQPSK